MVNADAPLIYKIYNMKYPDINIQIEYPNKLINADARLVNNSTLFSKASDTSKTFIVAKQLVLRNPAWLHLKANKQPFFYVKFHMTGSGSLAST